jgi:hypothetical protein
MSPTAFKQQVNQLISHLTRCYELCDNIIANRRISERHEHLNNLRAGLKAACSAIQIEFNTLRKVLGSRMDLGDDPARHALNRNIRELEIDIEARLYDIASRRTDGLPGFRDMLRRVQGIEDGSKDIIEDLGERLRAPPMPVPIPRPTTTPKPTEKPASHAETEEDGRGCYVCEGVREVAESCEELLGGEECGGEDALCQLFRRYEEAVGTAGGIH